MLGLAHFADQNWEKQFKIRWIVGLGPFSWSDLRQNNYKIGWIVGLGLCRWLKWTGLILIYDQFKIIRMPATWLPRRIANVASSNCSWRYWIIIIIMMI
jgi:hypothetical protein